MNQLAPSAFKLTVCVWCKLLALICCYHSYRKQRVEKDLIYGVGFSRLSENVRFPSSQVVHCESSKDMQIDRADVLLPFFPHWSAEVIPHWGDCSECTQHGSSVNKGKAMSL